MVYHRYHVWFTQSFPKKSSERSRLCADCDKKETGCTTASSADKFDLQQVNDVSMGVSKLGRMDLIFIDAGVKVNGVYYREVFMTQKLLTVMCMWDHVWKVIHLSARHRAHEKINLLERKKPVFTSAYFSSPNSTYWTRLTTSKWAEMQQWVYQVKDVSQLKQRLIDVWHCVEQSVIDDAVLMSCANVSVREFMWKEDPLFKHLI